MIKIRIKPTRELFFNEDQSFGIYGCEVNPDDMDNNVNLNQYGNISIKGITPRLGIKEEYEVILKEDKGSNYKGSYLIESIKKDKPVTVSQQKAFLSTILTEAQIENIYAVYKDGDNVVELIEKGEFDYSKIKGLGDKTFEKLKKKVMDNIDISEALAFLSQYGIKYNTISSLIKKFGNPNIVISKIEKNPYLLTEASGIGFKKADEIAKAVLFDLESPLRIYSCIEYLIKEENGNGHSWMHEKQLFNASIELLNIDKSHIQNSLNMIKSGDIEKLVEKDGRFTTKSVYQAEKSIALNINTLKANSSKVFDTGELDSMIDTYCEENDVELEENQRQFFHDWNENSILMLIGGGGMGKSWLQRILLEFIKKKNMSVALLAPTGKASKVMSGYTGIKASTIHRKIRAFDEDSAVADINEDVIIIDESSMCDVFILSKFFSALSNARVRVLFVGDDFQLPSVGVGNFLYDMINSNKVKISKLKKVFRQAEGGILNVATDVRENKRFLNETDNGRIVFGKDCVFWLTDSEYIKDGVISNYKKVIERFDKEDVVILTPTNKGKLGTIELNKEIQKIANPHSNSKKERAFGFKDNPTIFRVGDQVMNVVNTYGAETIEGNLVDVFNGDTGVIKDLNDDKKHMIIEIDGFNVIYKYADILGSIVHSWVTTIHKSQGSQYKVVIMIADRSMTYQLNANLLYTGLSRAKDYELVLTQARTINVAMNKFANMERRSFLQEELNAFDNILNMSTVEEPIEVDLDDIANF